ncbi:MAG: alpha/beta hydrolase [Candidatus Binatia bacterium]|nr:alpha/beta hydrolase [Candidatus Binatia bacterium]
MQPNVLQRIAQRGMINKMESNDVGGRGKRGRNAAFLIACSILLIAGCGGSSSGTVLTEPTPLPEALSELDASFHEAIAYGPSVEKNLFDILLPKNPYAAPLVIYFHGGDFTGGSRSVAWSEDSAPQIKRLIDADVAVASVDYRFLNRSEALGLRTPLGDGARSVQFIRLHAEKLGIDAARIVLLGDSVGAGMSLWIAVSDDRAEPFSTDPVLRQSTRVQGAILRETQASFDVDRWSEDVFYGSGACFRGGSRCPELEDKILDFYGISDLDDLGSSETRAYRRDVDMIPLMTADDPALFIRNQDRPNRLPSNWDLILHHPRHATTIADKASRVGIEYTLYAPALGIEDFRGENEVDFALRILAK